MAKTIVPLKRKGQAIAQHFKSKSLEMFLVHNDKTLPFGLNSCLVTYIYPDLEESLESSESLNLKPTQACQA